MEELKSAKVCLKTNGHLIIELSGKDCSKAINVLSSKNCQLAITGFVSNDRAGYAIHLVDLNSKVLE